MDRIESESIGLGCPDLQIYSLDVTRELLNLSGHPNRPYDKADAPARRLLKQVQQSVARARTPSPVNIPKRTSPRLRHLVGTLKSLRKYMNIEPLRAAEAQLHGVVVA